MVLYRGTKYQYVIEVNYHNLPIKDQKTWFISHIKVLGALDSPKGITIHSYRPSRVLNAVFHSSPGRTRIWWYLLHRSIFESIVAPCNRSIRSSNRGIRNQYFIVILLTTRLSIHIHHDPSFFGTKSACTAHGLMLSRMAPFSNHSCTWRFNSSCSWGFIR